MWPITNFLGLQSYHWNGWTQGRQILYTSSLYQILECWQLTCQFPTWRSPILCSFDRDNSMYEQQTRMLTTGLLNRNTGCQCCSVRCSSVSERHLGFSKVENFNFRSGSGAQYAPSLSPRRSWQRDIARYYVKNRKIWGFSPLIFIRGTFRKWA